MTRPCNSAEKWREVCWPRRRGIDQGISHQLASVAEGRLRVSRAIASPTRIRVRLTVGLATSSHRPSTLSQQKRRGDRSAARGASLGGSSAVIAIPARPTASAGLHVRPALGTACPPCRTSVVSAGRPTTRSDRDVWPGRRAFCRFHCLGKTSGLGIRGRKRAENRGFLLIGEPHRPLARKLDRLGAVPNRRVGRGGQHPGRLIHNAHVIRLATEHLLPLRGSLFGLAQSPQRTAEAIAGIDVIGINSDSLSRNCSTASVNCPRSSNMWPKLLRASAWSGWMASTFSYSEIASLNCFLTVKTMARL